MGFGHWLKKKAHKIGHKISHGAKSAVKIGNKIEHFVEKKALPMAEKISRGIAKGAKAVAPIAGMINPELGLAVAGVGKVAGGIDKGIHAVEKGLKKYHEGKAIIKTAHDMGHKARMSIEKGAKQAKRGDLTGAFKTGKHAFKEGREDVRTIHHVGGHYIRSKANSPFRD